MHPLLGDKEASVEVEVVVGTRFILVMALLGAFFSRVSIESKLSQTAEVSSSSSLLLR